MPGWKSQSLIGAEYKYIKNESKSSENMGPMLNEFGDRQSLWKRLRSSMPWSWLARPHFRNPRSQSCVGRAETILIYPQGRGDIVKVCLKNPGIYSSMMPGGVCYKNQDKGVSQSHLEFEAVPYNGVRGVVKALKLAHSHWTVGTAPCTEDFCLKVTFPNTDSEQFKL